MQRVHDQPVVENRPAPGDRCWEAHSTEACTLPALLNQIWRKLEVHQYGAGPNSSRDGQARAE